MIRFDNLDVYNWHNANRGMRNSWESWDKIDSGYVGFDGYSTLEDHGVWDYGPDDLGLALRLAKAGSDHAKFRRQILVGVDIIAGNEWWKEFDTYKIGTTANSTSMMHKMGARLLTMSDFSFDDQNDPYALAAVTNVNAVIQRWWDEGKKVGTPTWRLMQKIVPMGFVYRRTVTLNYEVLSNMYRSRRKHRLHEWRDFCAWVEGLPYSALITLKEGE